MSKINSNIQYDVVVTGSGLGGLVSALILAKEGKKVCVLEKNNQYGGNLQTFVREKTIFDTGVHYIGGLDKGQNLHTYFSYLNIMQDLKLKKLDENCFDMIHFFDHLTTYPLAQGYQNFVDQLVKYFPSEEKNIYQYIEDIKSICIQFPLYNVSAQGSYDTRVFELGLYDYLTNLTKNKKLQAVLNGNSLLYAGHKNTPFYVHALIMNSYIESSYRCINGGSQITRLLIKQLRNYNADIFKHSEVVKYEVEQKVITKAILKNGETVSGKLFISNIDPKTTLQQVGQQYFKKAYYNRIMNLEDTIGSFSVFIKLKPNQIHYMNKNLYFHQTINDAHLVEPIFKDVPKFLLAMNANQEDQKYAESLTILCYMDFEKVKAWENTVNTVANPTDRGSDYEAFKKHYADILVSEVCKIFPNAKNVIESYYTTTPLSYRDYIGVNQGNLYGPVKSALNPLNHFIATKSKIDNLYFTGQGVNMHGILGVTIGAVATCAEILGKDYLISKIKAHEEMVY
nr:NAD(P)/FAD-dependent oxidoreductase [uncultured Flavobacterium sp.]